MKIKSIIQLIIYTGILLTTAASCKYDEVLPFEPDPTVDVLFSQDIIPIFESSCISSCLLYTSDAADERSSVDLGGRRIINKKRKR